MRAGKGRAYTTPATVTGHVEQLKGNLSEPWSREISKSDRLIYAIEEDKVLVYVVSLRGHYGDK